MAASDMGNLIKCDDHGFVPGGIICVHLRDGASREWLRMSDMLNNFGPEAENDWVCPGCAENIETISIDDLITACVQCVRMLRKEYDLTFKE